MTDDSEVKRQAQRRGHRISQDPRAAGHRWECTCGAYGTGEQYSEATQAADAHLIAAGRTVTQRAES